MTVWLVKLEPYDPDTSSVIEVRYSLGSLTPKYDGKKWPARLLEPPRYRVSLDVDDLFRAGAATPRGSKLRILTGDGKNDALRGYNWEGRRVTVYRGSEGNAFGAFTTVLDTVVERVVWSRSVFELQISGFNALLDQPVQQNVYAGTGGLEGGSSLKDKPKPRVFGKPKNIEPTLVSEPDRIYQVSDGALSAIDAVYNGGEAMTLKADEATLSNYARLRYRVDLGVTVGNRQLSFSDDGTRMAIWVDKPETDAVDNALGTFLFVEPFDLRTARYLLGSDFLQSDFSQNPGTVVVRGGPLFGDSGNMIAVSLSSISPTDNYIYQVNLTSPYDTGTASYTSGDFFDFFAATSASNVVNLVWNDDGTKLYAFTGSEVFELDLSTAYDVTTASYSSASFNVLSALSVADQARSFQWNDDGTEAYCFVFDDANDLFGWAKFDASTAYDVTSLSLDEEVYYIEDGSDEGGRTRIIATITDDGKRFVTFGRGSGETIYTFADFAVGTAYTGLMDRDDVLTENQYATSLDTGVMVVNAQPPGVVTADVQGELDGSVLVQTAPDLVRYLVKQELTDPDDLDTASFTQAESDNNAPVSLYLDSTERPSINEVIPRIASSIGAIVRPGAGGKFGIEVIDLTLPSPSVTLTENDIVEGSLERQPPARPAYRVALDYDIAWRALTDAEIRFETADGEVVEFIRQGSRTAADSDSSILTAHVRARDARYETLLDESADASAEATRRLNLLKVRRDVYRFRLKSRSFEFSVGQVIKLQHPDLRETTALTMLVVSVDERRDSETVLEVWG